MLEFSFSLFDLEFFLLILTRMSCFVFVAPFFSMQNTPAGVRIGISFFTSVLLYQVLTPTEAVKFDSVFEYAVIIMKEAMVGLLVGLAANICTSIVNFAGSIADMETGLSMVTLMDPATRESVSISGGYYQYSLMLMMIASGMYRYLFSAMADTFTLIPINGAVFRGDAMLNAMVSFLGDYVIIGFRIVLPVFCSMLLLNAILGILVKVSPQVNMFSVGLQLKILVGFAVMFLTVGMLPGVADFIFQEMKLVMDSFIGALQ